jgi:hypothetical protein
LVVKQVDLQLLRMCNRPPSARSQICLPKPSFATKTISQFLTTMRDLLLEIVKAVDGRERS